jgi:PKD repeat protein
MLCLPLRSALSGLCCLCLTLLIELGFSSCGSTGKPASPPIGTGQEPTTTTLAAETANNTSAPASFPGEPNGNSAAGNVSKLPINSLLYPGNTTKIYAHLLPWFGTPGHINVGYNSNDPNQVHLQVEDMMSRGINGVIIDWYGPNNVVQDQTAQLFRNEAQNHAGFEFAITEDAGALFNAAQANSCDVTAQLLSDLSYIGAQYLSSPAYLHLNGKLPIFMFGVTGFFVDWSRVLPALPANAVLLFRGMEGLQQSFANGGFAWVDIASPDAFNEEIGAQDAFYSAALQSGRLTVGSSYKGFFDSIAAWGTDRQVAQHCGQTWLDTFADPGKFFNSGRQLPALQIVTWNDYEEGTSIESGIDNCVVVAPSLAGTTLNWTVSGGNENTIDHYVVFSSTDGQNLAKLADVPAGTHSFDFSKSNVPSEVSFFVKAVGKPSIRNFMSAPVAFRANDQAPSASLSVAQAGDLAVHVTLNTSGAVASTQIDFGDGTVVAGPTATHKYANAGEFVVTGTAVDKAGASAVAATRVEAKAAAPGVTILTPGNSATVNWPTLFVATANSGAPIARMNVLMDGQPIFATDRGVVNTTVKIMTGSHQITVEAVDAAGATSQASISVVAEPDDAPPVPVITMRQLSDTTVLACGAQSHDPDGFVNMYHWQFSDGATFGTPAAVHTFAAPGSFSVTLTVTDQFGASASTSTSGATSAVATAQEMAEEQRRQAVAKRRVAEPVHRR